MEVALIRIDPNKNSDDGRPKIVASTVVDTNLKTANQTKLGRDDLLALTRTKFFRTFPGRRFPTSTKTTDGNILQWTQRIQQEEQREHRVKAAINQAVSTKAKILVNAIVLATDPDCKRDTTFIAIGQYVYVKCTSGKYELPTPVLLMESAGHYFFQKFCIITKTEFEKFFSGVRFIPCSTADTMMKAIKKKIENGESAQVYSQTHTAQPIDINAVVGSNPKDITARGNLVPLSTSIPADVADLLREISKQSNTPINHIITDCILSKYGNQ